MLAAYSFQIYFDFAGYSDIAIGTGMLLGFQLPENFNHPYRQPNLTLFLEQLAHDPDPVDPRLFVQPPDPIPAQEQESCPRRSSSSLRK